MIMAKLRLGRYELEKQALPQVCMKCGQPAEVWKKKQFSWHSPWIALLLLVGLLPYVIVALILTKRMRVTGPFCANHRNHWFWRPFIVGGAFFVLVGVVIFLFWLAEQVERARHDSMQALAGFSILFGILSWLILVIIVQYTSIRAVQITDRSITLVGLAPGFVDAVLTYRHKPREDVEQDVLAVDDSEGV
jgi:hypothetical protein